MYYSLLGLDMNRMTLRVLTTVQVFTSAKVGISATNMGILAKKNWNFDQSSYKKDLLSN